jgi:hypothetical protein
MGGFNNPVVGGLALIRKAIRSPDYQAGTEGWSVNQDGSAEFNDITVRGEVDIVGTDGSHIDLTTHDGSAEIEFQPPDQPGVTFSPASITTASASNSAWVMISSPYEPDAGTKQAIIQLEGSDGLNGDNTAMYLEADTVEVLGNLQVDGQINPFAGFTNIAVGTILITPSASNTPTSVTVNYGPLDGATFTGFVSAATTVPGSQVTGVGITGAGATSAVLWVTRTNTNQTRVNWMVWGS